MNHRIEQGRHLAVAASVILIISAVGSSLLGLFSLLIMVQGKSLAEWVIAGPMPVLASICYLGAMGGTAFALVALLIYGYRARWFWGCLVATASLWIMAPPLFTVIGLVALIVLLRSKGRFPHHLTDVNSLAP